MERYQNYVCRRESVAWGVIFVILIALISSGNVTATPTPTTITLSWTAPGDDVDSGQAAEYDLRYSTSVITDGNWNAATRATGVPAPQSVGSPESFTVTGLTPGTLYYFAIKTADEVPNWSSVSNIVSQSTTPEQTAPATIATITTSAPTQTSLTLNWTAPGDDGTTGTAAEYDIRYSTSPINESNWDSAAQVSGEPTPQTAGSSESFTITGLSPSTMYYFAIKTADEIPNWSGLSAVINAQTAGDQVAPSAIDDLQASIGNNEVGQLVLSWTAPGDDGMSGAASAYEIRYSTTEFDATSFETAELWTSPPVPLPGGTAQEFVLTDLQPGEIYYVGIRSWDDFMNPSGISNIDTGVAYFELVLDVDDGSADLPEVFSLSQNYPNPFNPSTILNYTLPTQAHVNISVFNIQGRLVRALADTNKPAGEHTVEWNGTDEYGSSVATGVYFYRMAADEFSETRKMVLVK